MSERTENHICAHCGAKLLRVESSAANWSGLECDNPECITVDNRRLRAYLEAIRDAALDANRGWLKSMAEGALRGDPILVGKMGNLQQLGADLPADQPGEQ